MRTNTMPNVPARTFRRLSRSKERRPREKNWLSLTCAARYLGLPEAAFRLLIAEPAFLAQVRHVRRTMPNGSKTIWLYRPDLDAVYGRLVALENAANSLAGLTDM